MRKSFGAAFMVMAFAISLGVLGCRWGCEAREVAHEELGPRALLQKYEWFKNTAAELDAKRADIRVLEGTLSQMISDYAGISKRDWPWDEREAYNQRSTELAGLKMSYNGLASEYNSQMAKINWRFANAGGLPEGATDPLPREFAPYRTE